MQCSRLRFSSSPLSLATCCCCPANDTVPVTTNMIFENDNKDNNNSDADNSRYLGIHLSNTLNWTTQTKTARTKAQQTLAVIRRNLNKCPTHIKAVAYTSLVRPILEYASAAWDPHSQNNIKSLERIQRQAARFCQNDYSMEPGSVTKLLQELGWESLQTRRKYKIITTLFKMEHNIIEIPLDQYIMHNTRCSRKHNSQFLQIRHSSNTFGNSFFPTAAKEWNALPSNIISSSSIESFQKKT